MSAARTSEPASRAALIAALVTVSLGLLLTYLFLVLPPDSVVGRRWYPAWWTVSLPACAVLWGWIYRSIRSGRGPRKWLGRTALTSLATALSLLGADTGYRLYQTATGAGPPGDFTTDMDTRRLAAYVQRVYPTEKSFRVYRGDVSVQGYRYGDLYSRAFLDIPELARRLGERRHVAYRIDRHGFRETTPRERACVFALGDSFTFGATTQERTWVKGLERELGLPTYNLGVSGASPRQELLLLERLVEERPGLPNLRRVLWMIFEGNDLEDSYQSLRPPHAAAVEDGGPLAVAGWLVRHAGSEVRKRSLVRQLLAGDLQRAREGATAGSVPLDRLPIPVYYSVRHGYKAFHREYIGRAGLPRSYVEAHPNRAALDQTFRDMKTLSARHGFDVTVLLAPTDARLYAPHFRDFPPVSPAPYFLDYVEALASSLGFDVAHLYRLMQPHAADELLYYRDDTHWNERGNAIVAALIAAHARARSPRWAC